MDNLENVDNHTVQLSVGSKSKYLESFAIGDIYPGMLLLAEPGGQVFAHNVADSTAEAFFAVENIYHGKSIDDVYSDGQRVMARICQHGDIVLCYVPIGTAIIVGTVLCSSGNGMLHTWETSFPYSAVVGISMEKLNGGVPVEADTRVRVKIF